MSPPSFVPMSILPCDLCPRNCKIAPGSSGFCFIRQNISGRIDLTAYGRTTGLAIDPIEKKPLYHFHPGSGVLSLGTIGCNLGCTFCQNWSTSKSRDLRLLSVSITPERIANLAVEKGCKSVAFTYNEPIVWAEYAVDTAWECRKKDVKTVCVSAGYISTHKREWFFAPMDAVNIDLKSFREDFYRKKCGASLEPVKETLVYLARKTRIWLEITNLLIPGENDSEEEISTMCEWIRKELGSEVPLHFSAFRPAYQERSLAPTSPQSLFRAREIARKSGLCFVYTGNISDPAGQSTYCPQCKQTLIFRNGYRIEETAIDEESCCKFCGQSIAGRFE